MTTVADGLFQYGGMPVTPGVPVPFTGTAWWVDPVNGSDGNTGKSPSKAFATLYKAHASATSGKNDVVYLIGNGAASGTARLSTALAQSVDSTATTGVLTWSKDAVHLIGVCSTSLTSQRARIAPPTGTYTQATFGSGNFIVVSGNGCHFQNLSIYHGFSTGGTNQIALTVTGSRNAFVNVSVLGMNDAASANDAGSRSVKVGSAGSGENVFYSCFLGDDTTARTAANATVELAGGTPRNAFVDCVFPVLATGSGSGAFFVLGTGASCVDRFNLFKNCVFVSDINSTGSALTAAMSFTNAAPGGLLLVKNSILVGGTKWGDTNALANSYIDMPVVSAAAGGLALNPS